MTTFLFERPNSGERALLLNIEMTKQLIAKGGRVKNVNQRKAHEQEFYELVTSAGAKPIVSVAASCYRPVPKFFVGTGKVQEISELVEMHEIELVLVDCSLSPSQERNLEKTLKCRVLDRTGLILDIFSQRARSFEGNLQVELAQLKHISTRLIRGWTHLERQKGGIGMRGPGESQLETDRRLIGDRIKLLTRKLEKVSYQRHQSRAVRRKTEVQTVSLVGYTNAGKSTLFNSLTGAKVYVEDQLFATLDPTLRQLVLEDKHEVVLADTVGFIRELPHDLIAAFRSTLQETEEASLLLHVVDVSDDEHIQHMQEVNDVLKFIGVDSVPQLIIYNKIDNTDTLKVGVRRDDLGVPKEVYLSAKEGLGMNELRAALQELLADNTFTADLCLEFSEGKLRSQLHALGVIQKEETNDAGQMVLTARFTAEIVGKYDIDVSRLKR